MLHHFKDGRAVSIDDGDVDEGDRVGCENNAHAHCKGTSFVLQGENFSTLSKIKGSKIMLALRDGRGLAIEHADFDDAPDQRRSIRMTSGAKAIEVEFKSNGEAVANGLRLHGERNIGKLQYFSGKHGEGQWQFNVNDGTISPRGAHHLVLGWRGNAQLVKRGDAAQLQFIRPGCCHSDKVSFLSEALHALLLPPLSVMSPSLRSAVLSPATFVAMMKAQVHSSSMILVEEMKHKISPEMLRATLKPNTAEVALHLLELGAEITDEDRCSLFKESGNAMSLIANPQGLARWYSFDKLVEGEGSTLRVGNCAPFVNPDLPHDDDHSLISAFEFGEAPKIVEKWGRAVAEFSGKHGLGSNNTTGCPTGNDAYSVEVWMEHPPSTVQECVPFVMGLVNNGDNKALGISILPSAKGMECWWWSNDFERLNISPSTWNDSAAGDHNWLRVAATWDPSNKSRRIFVNGKMVGEDNAQGQEHQLAGGDQGGVLGLGNVIGYGAAGSTHPLTGCIAEVRVWKRALDPTELFSELAIPCKNALEALVLDTCPCCQALVKELCDRDDCIRAAVQCPTMLLATLKSPRTADAALQLLEVHNVKITDEVRDKLLAKDLNKKSMLEKLILDGKCTALVNELCSRNATINAWARAVPG